jgi:hypothetical protein
MLRARELGLPTAAAGHAPESDDAIQKPATWVRPELGLV